MAKRNERIKPAGLEIEYTPEQIHELKKCAEDPVYFISQYVYIQHPVKGSVPFKLYPYQERMIRAYQKNRFNVVLSSRQTGKALSLDTEIPTPNGWTTMKDLKVGDEVFGDDGTPTKITATSGIMQNRTCYRLRFDTNDEVIADAEHLWEVRDEYSRKTRVLTTEQMFDSKYVTSKNQARYTVKTTKPLNLPEQLLQIDPYTLGVWLGDGTARTGEITTHINDIEILENVDGLYEQNRRFERPDKKDVLRTTLKGLRTRLRGYDLVQNKHIPLIYKRSSYRQRLALLQGLMDTDGTVDSLGRGQCDITLANKTLAEDVYELIASLGLKPKFKTRQVNGFIRYEVKFSAYRSQIEIFRLKRKLNKMKMDPHPSRLNSTKKRSIQRIEKVDSVPVKCICVDNDSKLFLFGRGLIPTHNSITSAAFLLWYASFNFDKTILIASNKNSNAMEMISRIRYAYENLPFWLKPGADPGAWNKHELYFDNDSRIISTATSENSGRGMSISLLFLDEFAFVKPAIQDEFWASISPTLSTGGSCIMSSTPNGDMDIFAQIWRGAQVGVNGFFPIEVKWNEPPGRDGKFEEEEMARVGERKWRQEYLCEFLSSDALLMDSLWLTNATKTLQKIKPQFDIKGVEFWQTIQANSTYLVGVDPSTGTGNDFAVIEVYKFPEMTQVAQYRNNTMSSPVIYDTLKSLLKFIEKRGGMTYFSVENNGVGEGIIALFQADETPPDMAEFVSEEGANRLGMTTTKKTKMRACLNLKEMLERGKMAFYSQMLLRELKMFVQKGGSYNAQAGGTDDCVSATLIVIRLLEEIATYEQEAYNKLYNYEETDDWDAEYTEIDPMDPDYEPLPVLVL